MQFGSLNFNDDDTPFSLALQSVDGEDSHVSLPSLKDDDSFSLQTPTSRRSGGSNSDDESLSTPAFNLKSFQADSFDTDLNFSFGKQIESEPSPKQSVTQDKPISPLPAQTPDLNSKHVESNKEQQSKPTPKTTPSSQKTIKRIIPPFPTPKRKKADEKAKTPIVKSSKKSKPTPKFDFGSTLKKITSKGIITPTNEPSKPVVESNPKPVEVEPDQEFLNLVKKLNSNNVDNIIDDTSFYERMLNFENQCCEIQDQLTKYQESLDDVAIRALMAQNEVLLLLNPILDQKVSDAAQQLLDASEFLEFEKRVNECTEVSVDLECL
ncbi:hypothetical protein P9112_010562 [Eukaryota sp. TZLM1-RC]